MAAVYNILEVANCHGGDPLYVSSLLDEFSSFQNGFGIKFQPFQADKIASADFDFYEIYKQLEFTESQWRTIITKARQTKDVWLDLFDDYSVTILRENINLIIGAKLQPSILLNQAVLSSLGALDLSSKYLILNISGYSHHQIKKILNRYRDVLNVEQFILQVGFQDYPTDYVDSGLTKIEKLKRYSCPLSFADHVNSSSDEAVILPLLAMSKGCEYIEKHVMHSSREAKYDHYSALTVSDYARLVEQQNLYLKAAAAPFVNEKEQLYLKKTLQIPLVRHDINAGQIPSLEHDVDYKRTNKQGLNTSEVMTLLEHKRLLRQTKHKGETFDKGDFRKAKIATMVACRMKSSRLKDKALLQIGHLSSVETCLRSCLKFKDVDYTVLATSTHPDDAVLSEHTYSDDILFRRGDPEDVIQRYIDIIDELKIDVFVRVTADMPYVSSEICGILLNSHFQIGADYSCAQDAALGTSVEIYNAETIRTIKKHIPKANMSEYMTYYVTNNETFFKINRVELPVDLIRPYRLTLDYKEDLQALNVIAKHLDEQHCEPTIRNIFTFLDENSSVVKINDKMEVQYRSDQNLISLLQRETKFPQTPQS